MNKRIDEKSDPFGPFNLNDFKKWMGHQQDAKSKPNMIGLQVESKITFKRLLSRIETQDGEIEEVAKDFKKNGGTITEVNGQNILIEVDSGSFLIHRMYVKREND
jgi:translation initiation factor 1 (eIF-1/SUI1)